MDNNQTKKPFDRNKFEADLTAFDDALRERIWSFEATNYADYLPALQGEAILSKEAERLGIQGINMYRHFVSFKLAMTFEAEATRKAERAVTYVTEARDKLRAELDALKLKVYTPLDWFKEKDLVNHDWFYDYSDDPGVYRRGKASETQLIRTAKEGGADWQQALVEAWNTKYRRTDVTWASLEAKLPYEPKPPVYAPVQPAPVLQPKSGEPLVDLDKPFGSSKDFVQDHEVAKVYLARCESDYKRFMEDIQMWTISGTTTTVDVALLSELHARGCLEVKGESIFFDSFDCFAAWYLARFW